MRTPVRLPELDADAVRFGMWIVAPGEAVYEGDRLARRDDRRVLARHRPARRAAGLAARFAGGGTGTRLRRSGRSWGSLAATRSEARSPHALRSASRLNVPHHLSRTCSSRRLHSARVRATIML